MWGRGFSIAGASGRRKQFHLTPTPLLRGEGQLVNDDYSFSPATTIICQLVLGVIFHLCSAFFWG